MQKQNPTGLFWALALTGFIPFAGLAAAVLLELDPGLRFSAVTIFLFWSLAILSFLGGIRWGLAISTSPVDALAAVLSVIPCILGWLALALPVAWTILVLGLLFVLHGWWDARAFAGPELGWFRPIRLVLTTMVAIAHLLVFWKLA